MFRQMRRSKQLLPEETAVDILNRNMCGVLSLMGDEDYPYGVPISYVYGDGKIYFHSAKTGHKIDAIRKYEKASFCVIDQNQIVPEKFTTHFRSAIVFGKIRIVEDEEEMREIMTMLGMKYAADYKDKMPKLIASSLRTMAVIELSIEHMSAKAALDLVNMEK